MEPAVKPETSKLLSPGPPIKWAASIWLIRESMPSLPMTRLVFVKVKSASRVSTTVSTPPPPVSSSFPEPPMRISSPVPPFRISLLPPPSSVTEPSVKAEASIVLALSPPVSSACSMSPPSDTVSPPTLRLVFARVTFALRVILIVSVPAPPVTVSLSKSKDPTLPIVRISLPP